MHTLQYTNN